MQLKILEIYNSLLNEQERSIKVSDIMFFNKEEKLDLSAFNKELPLVNLMDFNIDSKFEKEVLMHYIPNIYNNPRY